MDNGLKKLAIKDLEQIKSIFDRHGVRFLIVYGVLLGFYRDKDFLPVDDDIDIAVIDPIDLKTRKDIGWELYNLGFNPQQIGFNVFGRMEPSELGYNGDGETGIIVCERNFKFTIFFFKKQDCNIHDEEYVCVPKLGALKLIATPTKFFKETSTIKINGVKYLTPSPIDEYLAFSYKDWKNKDMRDHSPTFFEAHQDQIEMINVEGQNQVTKYENLPK